MSAAAIIVAIAGTALTAIALPPLLLVEAAGRTDLRYKLKPIASAGFLIVAAAATAWRGGWSAPFAWIAAGLVLGAIGDVALMFPGQRAFLAGLVAFLIGHVAYVIAFSRELPFASWPDTPHWLVALPILAALVALGWLWSHLGAMKLPVVLYVVTITTMVVGALAVQHAAGDFGAPWRTYLATAGAIAFFASDLAVARDAFVAPGFVNKAWGLPVYYAAQLLFAWSVAP